MENEKKPVEAEENKKENKTIEDKKHKLKDNAEVGFLYEKCKLVKPNVISKMVFTPEYIEAIKAYDGYINDYVLYNIIRKKYKEMQAEGKDYRTARDIMRKISRDVKGDSLAFEKE